LLIRGIDTRETPRRAALRDLRRERFHRVGRTRFAHRTMRPSVEGSGCGKRIAGSVEWRDLARWAMKLERVEIVFAGSALQRVKKTSAILLSVPN
jgi:hypothetical protein